MSLTGLSGDFGFAVQSAKIGRNGTFTPGSYSWFRHPAVTVAIGTTQEQMPFPLEVGGSPIPRGMFKQAYFFTAQADILPRLDNSFGWLLKGLLGNASSVADTDPDGVSVTGLNTHIFRFSPTDPVAIPWMAFRRRIPGDNFVENGFDSKIANIRFTVPNKGKLAARVGAIGRDILLQSNPTLTWANTMEESDRTPNSGKGAFYVGPNEYPIVGASLDVMNELSTPDEEAIIGDYRMDDITVKSRMAQFQIQYKYENADLYRKLLTNSPSGTQWSEYPYTENQDTSGYAFDLRMQSDAFIGTTGRPFEIRFRGGRVVWSVDGPPVLAQNNLIIQNLTGTIVEPASGQDFLQVVLVNSQTGY